MKKCFFRFLLFMLPLAVFCAPAHAAVTTTEYSLGSVYAKLSLSDSYIVLQEENLGSHSEVLKARNTTAEAMQKDWQERGVQLQAWTPDLDACLEIRTRQDEDSARYFDIDAQNTTARAAYRSSHLRSEAYQSQGYDVKSAEWKKSEKAGRFLQIKYKRNVNGLITWGYAEKTVRNGWTVVLDYQVYGRGLKDRDLNSLRKALKTLEFTQVLDTPGTAAGVLTFTETPPAETNTGVFTVEGNATPGAHLIGVIMKYANPTPTRIETDAGEQTGKFKLNVKLPDEGIWLMTLTLEKDGNVIAEHVFETTTYQKTLLPVTFNATVPEQFESDEFTLSGKTVKGVSLQCIVTGGSKGYDKTVRTNNNGKFSFHIPTDNQSVYNVTLILQKKNYETRRFSWTANRTLTDRDVRNQYREEAVKPAYSTLNRKLEAYTGRVMGYKVYITDIQHVGDEYIVTAAMTKTKKGNLKDIIVISSAEEPVFVVGSEQVFYGRLTGLHEVQSEEGATGYPHFELLFWDE